jgi:hypothetical protein
VYTSFAQFFSGNYHSEPTVEEFDYLKIHHHHLKHHKYEGDLNVKGFSQTSELWELKAKMISGEKSEFFINKFSGGEKILTVYEFKLEVDGIEEDYILLGHKNSKGHGQFIVIEEIFNDASEEEMLSLKTFKLIRKR